MALDKEIPRTVRGLAAQRGISISAHLAQELGRTVGQDHAYEQAKALALAQLDSPLDLGGQGIRDREALHDRQGLR